MDRVRKSELIGIEARWMAKEIERLESTNRAMA